MRLLPEILEVVSRQVSGRDTEVIKLGQSAEVRL